MTTTFIRLGRRLGLALAGACLAGTALAADGSFPSKPITLVVPFPAGGVIDTTGRMIAEKMAAQMKATIVVENRPGAGGTLGSTAVARAPADGYTLLMGDAATQVYSPAIFKQVKYDPARSFASIGQVSYGPLVVIVGPKSKATTMNALLDELKTGGDKVDYGSNSIGSTPHLATEMFKKAVGINSTHIPFNGGPANMSALAGGEVSYSINHIPLAQSIIATGRVRPLATTGATRSPVFPDLPTLTELGVKGYEAYSWIGVFAPAGLPAEVQKTLSSALQASLDDPDLKKRMAALGDVAKYRAPAEFDDYIAGETKRWVPLIQTLGISLNN